MHRIEAADPYSDGYDATVAKRPEQNADDRPIMAAPLPSIGQYDTVLLASGIWNVRAPMIMTTFAERYRFSGKTVHAVTTYAMSGLGTAKRDYARSCPGAAIGEGLAVRGEEDRDAGPDIKSWLHRTGLLESQPDAGPGFGRSAQAYHGDTGPTGERGPLSMTSEREHKEAPTGNVALVTGASRGVGRGIAVALLAAGFRVYGSGRSIDQADLPPGNTAAALRPSQGRRDGARV